ncbi:histidine kinase [Maribrevibacterium harenarium]|uniref:histidine kinase n=1 Tax=Maribrevibacterium harenarium TaxID=2589817 RepID=A0A501WM08_9GAMM|nr:cache domain-containing protein [Maribrevibacterium harenarium]TPE49204.1 histidine kinase [Maribrevibacterium harenarium]
MKLKSKILLLTVVPLVSATAIITYLGVSQAKALTQQQLALYEQRMIETRKQALKDQVAIAMSAIRPVLDNYILPEEEAKRQVKQILTKLRYNDDGYFFAYTQEGINLVHPTQPEFVGENLLDFQDREGNFLIKNLLIAANSGGGFHRYIWEKPPQMQQEHKLSYVELISRWQWMMGTGLYLDDIYDDLRNTQTKMNENISRSLFTVVGIMVLTVALVILLGLLINLHEHRLADARLKTLIQRFIRLQISERRRFSRELHDGINQLLVSSKFRIEVVSNKLERQADPASIRSDLIKAEEVINQTIQEVRQISHSLRPMLLDDLGLEVALSSLLEQFAERTKIQVTHHFTPNLNQLPEEIEITLYRLTQECLSNIEKHADATKVDIQLYQKEDTLYFECQDNGKGFDPKDKQEGIGLLNMRERLELVEGQWSLSSTESKGTKVKASLPVGIVPGELR